MKKAVFSLSSFLLLFLLVNQQSFAKSRVNVNVNSSNDSSSTSTNTQDIHTRIEIETNGEKKVLDEYGPGEYSLESNSNGGETSVSVNQDLGNITPTKTATKAAEEKNDMDDSDNKVDNEKRENVIKSIFENIKNFLLRIFTNL